MRYPDIVQRLISYTDINRYQPTPMYAAALKEHILINLYCDFPRYVSNDVITYKQAILLADSHHWNHSATLPAVMFD